MSGSEFSYLEQRCPLSIMILTYNEEKNLHNCLKSVCDWAGEIFVVDSGSTDSTLAIADKYGASVINHPFETHARQWNWALRSLPCRYDWIFGLDADQRVTPELAREICEVLGNRHEKPEDKSKERLEDMDGFYVKRCQVFRGKWIKHGGYYPKYMLKVFRRGRVWLDETLFPIQKTQTEKIAVKEVKKRSYI